MIYPTHNLSPITLGDIIADECAAEHNMSCTQNDACSLDYKALSSIPA